MVLLILLHQGALLSEPSRVGWPVVPLEEGLLREYPFRSVLLATEQGSVGLRVLQRVPRGQTTMPLQILGTLHLGPKSFLDGGLLLLVAGSVVKWVASSETL